MNFVHIVKNAKAYAAAAASVVAVLAGLFGPDTEVGHLIAIATPILAWVATWRVPNAPAKDAPGRLAEDVFPTSH